MDDQIIQFMKNKSSKTSKPLKNDSKQLTKHNDPNKMILSSTAYKVSSSAIKKSQQKEGVTDLKCVEQDGPPQAVNRYKQPTSVKDKK